MGNQKAKATKATGKKRKDDFSWLDSIPETLTVMVKALRLKTERIWQTAPERDTFVSCVARSNPHRPAARQLSCLWCCLDRNCFMKPANLIAESEVYMKNAEIKMGVYKIICVAAKTHGQAFSPSLLLLSGFWVVLTRTKVRKRRSCRTYSTQSTSLSRWQTSSRSLRRSSTTPNSARTSFGESILAVLRSVDLT